MSSHRVFGDTAALGFCLACLLLQSLPVEAATAGPAVAVDRVDRVQVFSDRARVTRIIRISVPNSGRHRIDVGPLPMRADPESLQVSVRGGQLEQVDTVRGTGRDGEDNPPASDLDARIRKVEQLTSEVRALVDTRDAWIGERDALRQIRWQFPSAEEARPLAPLDPSRWAESSRFVAERTAAVQKQLHDVRTGLTDARNRLEQALAELESAGGPPPSEVSRRVVLQVSAAGAGSIEAELTYDVGQTRWLPAYVVDAGSPSTETVQVSLQALVEQRTGENWAQTRLSVSTARPVAVQLPELPTWKWGRADRFIPTPRQRPRPVPPGPPTAPLPSAVKEPPLRHPAETGQRARMALRAAAWSDTLPPVILNQTGGDAPDEASVEASDEAGASRPIPPSRPSMPPELLRKQARRESRTRVAAQAPSAPPPSAVPMVAMAAPLPESDEKMAEDADSTVDGGPTESWTAPRRMWAPSPPGSPAALADGKVLEWDAPLRLSIDSGAGTVQVPLGAWSLPVRLRRDVYPALAPTVHLVGSVRNTSSQSLLPGVVRITASGQSVGEAAFPLLPAGAESEVPLGIDERVQVARRIDVDETRKGVFTSHEVATYTVTTELRSGHPTPVEVHVHDQLPLTESQGVEVRVDKQGSTPGLEWDPATGHVHWTATLPPGRVQPVVLRFSITRPKGTTLQQWSAP